MLQHSFWVLKKNEVTFTSSQEGSMPACGALPWQPSTILCPWPTRQPPLALNSAIVQVPKLHRRLEDVVAEQNALPMEHPGMQAVLSDVFAKVRLI